jgi:hypothetical protein
VSSITREHFLMGICVGNPHFTHSTPGMGCKCLKFSCDTIIESYTQCHQQVSLSCHHEKTSVDKMCGQSVERSLQRRSVAKQVKLCSFLFPSNDTFFQFQTHLINSIVCIHGAMHSQHIQVLWVIAGNNTQAHEGRRYRHSSTLDKLTQLIPGSVEVWSCGVVDVRLVPWPTLHAPPCNTCLVPHHMTRPLP